ncbi:HTH-type transcriptional repressor YvoA [Collinsella intestinalis]|nr:HTH-type transcriptional repressor YvoA [Collinsella intestinalis]
MADEHMGIPPKDRAQEGIRCYIREAHLAGGDKLPSERVLSERLGVSRTALRAAITQLISMHVLESRRGSGTYVLPSKPISIFQETRSFSDAVRRVGRTPGARLIDSRLIEADETLARKIDLSVGAPVFEVCRVRLADDTPVALETSYINGSLCPGIEAHDFSRESLYDVLAIEHGVRVGHGVERVSIARAMRDEAQFLDMDEGDPVFFVQALERMVTGEPVEYLKAVYVPSRYRFASNGCKNGETPQGVKSSWLTW